MKTSNIKIFLLVALIGVLYLSKAQAEKEIEPRFMSCRNIANPSLHIQVSRLLMSGPYTLKASVDMYATSDRFHLRDPRYVGSTSGYREERATLTSKGLSGNRISFVNLGKSGHRGVSYYQLYRGFNGIYLGKYLCAKNQFLRSEWENGQLIIVAD